MAETSAPVAIRREDYRAPPFRSLEIDLAFDLHPDRTTVLARTRFRREDPAARELRLHGDQLELGSIALDGAPPGALTWRRDGEDLLVDVDRDDFTLEIVTRIDPASNLALSGLYLSNGVFCTQCEAEGFRRITFSQDRPDVMARYSVSIEADAKLYPQLLSNGNLIEEERLAGGRKRALWRDPHPKPSYLFALVAGDLASIESRYITRSGREVRLVLYASPKAIGQCEHALRSLERAMKWDEDVYGLEYDLDLYQIVAIGDFNMGAMENKGLNIFNTAATLAAAPMASDADFRNVERVIAHEYFHNWTGNRITCRDWFQLTLKEGLTVLRDQQFSADMGSADLERISQVAALRERQFLEDAGPLAHPIRPDSYIEINNFYTRTVYDKGAEVIRALIRLIGEEAFFAGMKLYVERHDGSAATCDDFVAAMADASGRDLSQFMRWYEQPGTPRVRLRRAWDAARGVLTIEASQENPKAIEMGGSGEPLTIPMALGLLDAAGEPVRFSMDGGAPGFEAMVELTEREQRIEIAGLEAEPILSAFRDFSAPVAIETDHSIDELSVIARADPNAFLRWDAIQELGMRALTGAAADPEARPPAALIGAIAAAIDGAQDDLELAARLIALPSIGRLTQAMRPIDPEAALRASRGVKRQIGEALEDRFRAIWRALQDEERGSTFSIEARAIGRRAMINAALSYLRAADPEATAPLAREQFDYAQSMTTSLGALANLTTIGPEAAADPLAAFLDRWRDEPLVVDKWFAVQAMVDRADAVETLARLLDHPLFTADNPNRARALLASFTSSMAGFHRDDGEGYRLYLARALAIDAKNPQLASRLIGAFSRWRAFAEPWSSAMRRSLERAIAAPGLSKDSYEVASKALGEARAAA